jgi:Ni/Fe-hydrogenase subunit HybB-like protein
VKQKLMRFTLWKLVFFAIMAAGVYATVLRFTQGLGASTNLSDRFPWGIWIGFDVLCGVMLAAGGFTLMAAVHIFHIERFKPIIRPTVLTAFLGYLLVCVALMFDLGRYYRIWHPLIMRNPHSVMFEVAYCVMLYTTVLALEFAPVVFERLRMEKPLRILHAVSIPLVTLGVILSTLHQSSLGSLYLIMPEKLYPFWYSPLLPVFFFISAIGIGLAMTIFESYMSSKYFHRQLELSLLTELGRILAVVLAVYAVLRFEDLYHRGVLKLVLQPRYETYLFLLEVVVGLLLPMAMLFTRGIRESAGGLYLAAVLTVLGFITNRLNVSITGMESAAGLHYVPKWTEMAVTAMMIAGGFALFGLATKYLPIFPERGKPAEAAAVLVRGRAVQQQPIVGD